MAADIIMAAIIGTDTITTEDIATETVTIIITDTGITMADATEHSRADMAIIDMRKITDAMGEELSMTEVTAERGVIIAPPETTAGTTEPIVEVTIIHTAARVPADQGQIITDDIKGS